MLCQLESIAVQVPLICFTNPVLTNQETKENLGLRWGEMAIQSQSLYSLTVGFSQVFSFKRTVMHFTHIVQSIFCIKVYFVKKIKTIF